MKLTKYSTRTDPEGIRVTCNCGAEYLIEGREDWRGDYVKTYRESDKTFIEVYQYETVCPDCGGMNYHGYDYRVFPNAIHYPMFEREDWEERFQIPDDGRKAYR